MLGLVVAIIFLMVTSSHSAPSITFPINSQVPPVAQVSQLFQFTFSPSTFTSDAGPISYALSAAPEWLSLNSKTQTLEGIPQKSDVGSTTFQLVARDDAGSTRMDVTLVILDNLGPRLGAPLLPQLKKSGPVSSPDTVLLYPLQPFSITFSPETFSQTSSMTIYYATSGNNTPLPSWLNFSPQNLAFTGTTPPLVSPTSLPQVYPVRLMASDVVGFASATAVFEIVVGYNILTFNVTYQSFSLKEGQFFQSPALSDQLTLNGQTVPSGDIVSITSDAPNWLTLNTQSISLGGVPPEAAADQNVTITVTDTYGDSASTLIHLNFSGTASSLFSGQLAPKDATIGDVFNYDIGAYLQQNDGATVTVELGSAASWLTYNQAAMTLSGTVPSNVQAGVLDVQVTASSAGVSQTENLSINVINPPTSGTSSTSSTFVRSTTSASTSGKSSSQLPTIISTPTPLATGKHDQDHSRRNLAIVLGVLLPLLFLLLLILALLFYLRRRKHRRERDAISTKQISRPIQTDCEPTVFTEVSTDGEHLEKQRTRTPINAPHLELPWAPDSLRVSRTRMFKRNPVSPPMDSNWTHLMGSPPIPPRSSKRSSKHSSLAGKVVSDNTQDFSQFVRRNNTLNYSRKRTPFRPTQSRQSKTLIDTHSARRASRAASVLSSLSAGLPSRWSGMGHGAGGFGPPGYMQVRNSWQNPRYSIAMSDDSRMESVDLETFPQPPQDSKGSSGLTRENEPENQTSIRLVRSDSLQRSSLSEERQKYLRDRARDKLESAPRFSSGWSSRRPSSSHKSIIERLRSPAPSSSIYQDENRRDTYRSYSKSSSVIVHPRATNMAETEGGGSEEPRHPPPVLGRNRVSYSSGQFDTAESSTESDSWVDEDLEEAYGPDGERRWQVSTNNSPLGSPLERPLGFGDIGTSNLHRRFSASRGYPPPLRPGTSERRWRLGERRGKRPVSVTESDIQRAQGSQRGNLAFV